MCGISAVYKYSSVTETDKERLLAMNDEMHYRGPDDRGIWNDEKCALAQVRLSIIGLQKGKQPLFNEDDSIVLICNGEIYNYIELKAELQQKGHIFKYESDSETILHLYEEYGTDCLHHLRGMFAFCLWDSKKKQLFAARDRVGEKTLYYAHVPCGIVFSTELKAILKHYLAKAQINYEQLLAPIRYTSPTSSNFTYIDQVLRVAPGEYIIVDEQGLEKHTYWKRGTSAKSSIVFDEAKKQTLNLMRESVNICLRSDVPVAVMLSGGIDSSAIATLAKETGREVHTITAGYKGKHAVDERDVAKRFAKEKGFIYHEVELDENDFKNCFAEFTQHMDEPVTDIAAFAQWALYKKVKDMGFKVLLSGNGGDELFYGYPYWNKLAESLNLFREHQSIFPWNGIEKKKHFLQFLYNNWRHVLYAGYPYKITDSSIGVWFYSEFKKFIESAEIVINNNRKQLKDIHLYHPFENTSEMSQLDFIYEYLFSKTMTMAYLYLSDRLGMGNSIEIRSPLLDYKLVEYVSALPQSVKYKADNPKYFLKEILKDIIPDYILHAPKRGFQPPPSFIKDVEAGYKSKWIHSNAPFYNSMLTDRILDLHCAKVK